MSRLPDSGFDRVAPFYDKLAKIVFGDALEKAQLALLPHVPAQAHILLIGGGSGWLLEQLLYSPKELHILYLEASPAMLQKARQRYHNFSHLHSNAVTFRLGTEQTILPHEKFDAVITPFLLDLFPDKRLWQLMTKLNSALIPGGLWLFTDFWPTQPPPLWQQILEKSMYLFFGLLSNVKARQFPDYARFFDELNLQEKYSYTFYSDFIHSKLYLKK